MPPPQKTRCNNDLTVLHIGNDFQRECTRTAGLLSIPLFLPLVPSNLTELNLSGGWSSLPARELGIIRRGCRLKKLVATGVRCATPAVVLCGVGVANFYSSSFITCYFLVVLSCLCFWMYVCSLLCGSPGGGTAPETLVVT